MSAASPDQPVFVLTIDAVRWGLNELRAQKIHPFFLAYLHLRQRAAEQGTVSDIAPAWDELGQYLRVKGGPPYKPYYRPFWHGTTDDPGRYWLNPNIAGSYAPSSLRKAPYRVIDTEGSRFSLKPDHAELALQHLLYGVPVSALAVGAFLYRDFGFVSTTDDHPMLEPRDLETVLRTDFHFQSTDAEFDTLFAIDIPAEPEDWFEPLVDDTLGVE